MATQKTTPVPKWTVIFIVHAADDQSRYYSEQLFTELLQAKSSDIVRVFVLRNTYDYFDNEKTHVRLWEIQSETPRLKRVLPKNLKGKGTDDNPDSFGNMNFGDAKNLRKILKLIRNAVGDSKILLFTWDHGCAFGIFNSEELYGKNLPPIKSGPTTDMLMVSELANAIRFGLGKVEMLIMMNCWMQSIETNTQLRECVEVLIGAETKLDWIGYNYIELINKLVADAENELPKLHTELNTFAKEIIDKTIEKYKAPLGQNDAPDLKEAVDITLNEMILCATRPGSSELTDLIAAIKRIATSLKKELPSIIPSLQKARDETTELTGDFGADGRSWCFVDIFDVFHRMNEDGLFNSETTTFQTIQRIFQSTSSNSNYYTIDANKFIVARSTGSDFITGNKRGNYGGISICFPNSKSFVTKSKFYVRHYQSGSDKEFKIAFALGAPEWAEFVESAVTGKIELGRLKRRIPEVANKNMLFEINGKFVPGKNGNLKFASSAIAAVAENEDGDLVTKNFIPTSDFINKMNDIEIRMDVDILIDKIENDIYFNLFEITCTGKNEKGANITYNIARGAGEPKRSGPGEPKRSGPGGLMKIEIERQKKL